MSDGHRRRSRGAPPLLPRPKTQTNTSGQPRLRTSQQVIWLLLLIVATHDASPYRSSPDDEHGDTLRPSGNFTADLRPAAAAHTPNPTMAHQDKSSKPATTTMSQVSNFLHKGYNSSGKQPGYSTKHGRRTATQQRLYEAPLPGPQGPRQYDLLLDQRGRSYRDVPLATRPKVRWPYYGSTSLKPPRSCIQVLSPSEVTMQLILNHGLKKNTSSERSSYRK